MAYDFVNISKYAYDFVNISRYKINILWQAYKNIISSFYIWIYKKENQKNEKKMFLGNNLEV